MDATPVMRGKDKPKASSPRGQLREEEGMHNEGEYRCLAWLVGPPGWLLNPKHMVAGLLCVLVYGARAMAAIKHKCMYISIPIILT